MAQLFGKEYTKSQLLAHVGDMSQIAGVRPVELLNGNERGIRALDFYTGSGLQFTVLQDKSMDIFSASYNGSSLCWHSPAGPVAPAYYNSQDDKGWLWSFSGGLLTTCGLTNAGAANEDEGVFYGQHGRAANIPAKFVSYGCDWENDDYIIWAAGEVREARLFGPNLLLKRSIHTRLGQSKIWIQDEIENMGHEDTLLMLLYHCNVGFPVIAQDAELLAVIEDMEPYDKEAEKGLELFDTFEEPLHGYKEQCFFIDHDVDEKGMVNTAIINRHFNNNQGLGFYMTYPKKDCPYYNQWKMVGEGAYVVGMEPGNCYPEGRINAKKRGSGKILAPGEKAIFHLELGVLTSNTDIRAFESKLHGMDM